MVNWLQRLFCLGDPADLSKTDDSSTTQENTEKKKKKRYAAYSMVRHSITDAFYEESGPRNQHDHLYNPQVHTHGLMAVPVRSGTPPLRTESSTGKYDGANETNRSKVALNEFTF